MERDFLPFTREMRKATAKQTASGVSNDKALASYIHFLDSHVASRVTVPTRDPEIKACFSKLGTPRGFENPTMEQVMELMSLGFPIGCTGNVYGDHAMILMGYHVKREKPLRVEWLVRNSHTDKPEWMSMNVSRPCRIVDVIPMAGEAMPAFPSSK
jgi:hypothetical protein